MMKSWQLLFLLLSPIAVVSGKFYSAAIARERLKTDLFVNYNPSSIPVPKGERIDVKANIELQHMDFNERDGAMNLIGLLDVSWHDPKLGWNPKDYNNLTRIPVSQKAVWVPDLEVYNNAPNKFLRMHRNGIVVLEHTGNVLWADAIEVAIFCSTNMHDWPQDRHDCKMSLGSWTYDGFSIDITNAEPNVSMSFESIDMKNTKYNVVNFTAVHVATVYSCCAEPYISLDYHITFVRRSAFAVIFRAPALCVVVLTLLALVLEPGRGEKIWLNGVSVLLIVSNLLYFARKVGDFARSTPLIVTFYSCSLVLVTLSHLISVFSLMAARSRFRGKLPARFSSFLGCSLARFVAPAASQNAKHADHAEFEEVKLQEASNLICADSTPNEWTQLAVVFERIALIAFAVIYLILGSICFV